MASASSILRSSSIIISPPKFSRFFSFRLYLFLSSSSSSSSSPPLIFPSRPIPTSIGIPFFNSFCTSGPVSKRSTLVNFSLPDSDSDTEASSGNSSKSLTGTRETEKSKLPPPYDPFNKKPAIEEPEDPSNLQEVFHKLRSDGFMNSAVKMFDGLSKQGLTHEALELFGQIKDKGQMPEVVAHTAVVEAYANAGQAKEAHRTYLRMLSSGVLPNAYTYGVLIKGLAASGDAGLLADAKKYVVEMIGKGMEPDAASYSAVFEAMVRVGKTEAAKEFLRELRGRGFEPSERHVRAALKENRGSVFRTVINILFDK